MFLLERKFYKINLNATIALKLDTRLKIANRNIVVLLVKGSIIFLFVNLKLIRLDNSSENQAPQNEIINSKGNNESGSSSS